MVYRVLLLDPEHFLEHLVLQQDRNIGIKMMEATEILSLLIQVTFLINIHRPETPIAQVDEVFERKACGWGY